MIRRLILYLLSSGLIVTSSVAQDPHFSQFFNSGYLVNPALIGSSTSDWRVTGNVRQQWNNAETPYNTASVNFETRVLKNVTKNNRLGVAAAFMSDQSLNGAFKTNVSSTSLAYHVNINSESFIGLGMTGQFFSRTLDLSALTFGEQFTSGGFNTILPTGETALSTMKPFVSVGVGMLYSFSRDRLSLNAGVSSFNVNRPKQTFLADPNQFLPTRFAAHMNLEYDLSSLLLVNFNSIFHTQSKQAYFSGGGSLGFDISNAERRNIMYMGAWYRSIDAVVPFWGIQIENIFVGASYDVTVSKQNLGPSNPRTLEISFIFRQRNSIPGVIPCPWK
jgi:type IX secretion system PorP/SprF family membrane protein